MKSKQVSLVPVLALCLVRAVVAQQEPTPTFSEFDTDENGQITLIEAERSAQLVGMFDQLDTDKDGQLSNEEYSEIELVSEN